MKKHSFNTKLSGWDTRESALCILKLDKMAIRTIIQCTKYIVQPNAAPLESLSYTYLVGKNR